MEGDGELEYLIVFNLLVNFVSICDKVLKILSFEFLHGGEKMSGI